MTESFFFEIPIYRCDNIKYSQEREIRYNKYFDQNGGKISDLELNDLFQRLFWQPWDYNEIVGWMRLFVLGDQIRGEYYFVTSKVRIALRKKRFEYYGKAFEESIYDDLTNHEIYNLILENLEEEKKVKPLKNRYLDLRAFDSIAKFVDWKALIAE